MADAGPGQDTSLDAVLAGIKPKVSRVTVCLRGDLADEIEQAEAEMSAFDTDDLSGGSAAARERLQELRAEADQSSVEFVFKALGRKRWTDLMAEHEPTEEGKKRGERFNAETFPFAAIAESCVHPSGVTFAGVERLTEKLNDTQFAEIWATCLDANLGTVSIPKSGSRSATR